jgi:hypothetical protein
MVKSVAPPEGESCIFICYASISNLIPGFVVNPDNSKEFKYVICADNAPLGRMTEYMTKKAISNHCKSTQHQRALIARQD